LLKAAYTLVTSALSAADAVSDRQPPVEPFAAPPPDLVPPPDGVPPVDDVPLAEADADALPGAAAPPSDAVAADGEEPASLDPFDEQPVSRVTPTAKTAAIVPAGRRDRWL
jgi:hypothetical protein